MKTSIQLFAMLLVMTGAITFQACNKDDDDDSGKTKTELITSGTWKMTAYTVNPAQDIDGDGDTETNYFDYIDGCVKDDVTTFKTNGTADVNEGASKCDPLDPQTYSIPWSFTSNETKIVVDGDEYTLVELSGSTMKISNSYSFGGTNYTEEVTFVH